MSESIEPLNLWNAADRPSLPPLRLHHLFAMMAVTAVLLARYGSGFRNSTGSRLPDYFWIISGAFGTLYAVLLATAITAVAYGIAWRRRGIRFFHEPGHWLFVAIVASYVLDSLLSMLIGTVIAFNAFVFWFARLPGAAAAIYIGSKQCKESRWMKVFNNKGLAEILPVIGDLALVVKILHARRGDRREGSRRDTLHWCGVAVQSAMSLLMIVYVASMFLLFVLP